MEQEEISTFRIIVYKISNDNDGNNVSFLKNLRNYPKTYETPKKFRIRTNIY